MSMSEWSRYFSTILGDSDTICKSEYLSNSGCHARLHDEESGRQAWTKRWYLPSFQLTQTFTLSGPLE